MNSSGMASFGVVLMTVLSIGATVAAVAVEPGSEYVPPNQLTHRGPPGPAQIELSEDAVPATAVERLTQAPAAPALFGVDASNAVSAGCAETVGTFVPEAVLCELASRVSQYVTKSGTDYVSLLIGPLGKPSEA